MDHRSPACELAKNKRAPVKLRFVHITDHHLRADNQLVRGYSTTSALLAVLRHIANNAGTIDFVVSTGDLVQSGTDAEYQTFLGILGAQAAAAMPGPLIINAHGFRDVPIYVVPGNHDKRTAFFRNLFTTVPEDQLMNTSFEYGNLRFVFLDWGPEGKAVASPALLSHLGTTLRDEMPTVLLMHHHVIPVGSRWLDLAIADGIDRFVEQITGKNVVGIFSGHTHATYEKTICGFPVYGLRSTCFQFVLQDELLCCLLAPHYRVVSIENGVLTTEIIEVPLS